LVVSLTIFWAVAVFPRPSSAGKGKGKGMMSKSGKGGSDSRSRDGGGGGKGMMSGKGSRSSDFLAATSGSILYATPSNKVTTTTACLAALHLF
jgi:hypothetical protein